MKRAKWIVTPIAAGAAVLAGEPSLARIMRNTIDPTASLGARGRIAEGVALIACTEGQRVEVTLRFTQGDVIGEGRTEGKCRGELAEARYPVRVVSRGPADFEPGQAEACAFAVNTYRGEVVDTRQWCREDGVELIEE